MMSTSGRLQLIKSFLSNFPSHYMSIFRVPNIVAKRIISLERRFFWGGSEESRSLVRVSWDILQAPKYLGGLDIGNFLVKNLGLLSKWW